ncbi:uncharacterized protein RCO7_08977 [Rhynchosporium graminicola]|uniref:Uncharacterized protein n=1 Tax=Rhynchosporium graminicola TaxID=2792576 RepID=A0A1E1JU77_9HELO|nr:uncharacterized protein RCO7_08977 [Rhynchosporium commune]
MILGFDPKDYASMLIHIWIVASGERSIRVRRATPRILRRAYLIYLEITSEDWGKMSPELAQFKAERACWKRYTDDIPHILPFDCGRCRSFLHEACTEPPQENNDADAGQHGITPADSAHEPAVQDLAAQDAVVEDAAVQGAVVQDPVVQEHVLRQPAVHDLFLEQWIDESIWFTPQVIAVKCGLCESEQHIRHYCPGARQNPVWDNWLRSLLSIL